MTARTGTLGRLSSWRWLAAWLCLACLTYLGYLPTATAATQDFNRAAELVRYRAWLKDFTQDLDRLSATRRPLSDAQLDEMFARTVVPGSRAAGFIRQSFARRAKDGSYISQTGPRRVFLGVLESGIPAGQGGLYPETDPALDVGDLTVWYLHVDVGDMTNTYLLSPDHFTPYRLPPPGKLERKAYPFLLMQTDQGALRLGGVSSELWGLIVYLHNAAY